MIEVKTVKVYFKDAPKPYVLHDVTIEETLTTLTVHNDGNNFSVVPMANLSHYDVELA